MGRVYAVASGKGGVGKTTTTANLGAALAAAGHGTVVVDADLGMANLGAALGVADDGPTLHDVLAGEAAVEDAVREAPNRPAVLPGSRDLDAFADAHPDGLAGVLDALAAEYEYVVVDTGAGLSTDSLAPLRAADEVVLVSTPDPTALDDTAKTATVTRRLGTPLRGLVVVRGRGERVDRARERYDGEVLGTIPEDDAVAGAAEAGVPLAEFAPRSPATAAYRRLAATLTGVEVPDAATAGAVVEPAEEDPSDDTADDGPADEATASAADPEPSQEAEGIVAEAEDATDTAGDAASGTDPADSEGTDATDGDAAGEPSTGDPGPGGPDAGADGATDGAVTVEGPTGQSAGSDAASDVGAEAAEGDAGADVAASDAEESASAEEGGDGSAPDEESVSVEERGDESAPAETDAAASEAPDDDEDAEKKGFLRRLFG